MAKRTKIAEYVSGAHIKTAGIRILERLDYDLSRESLSKTRYRIRHDCCAKVKIMTYQRIRKRERDHVLRCLQCGNARHWILNPPKIAAPDWPVPPSILSRQ